MGGKRGGTFAILLAVAISVSTSASAHDKPKGEFMVTHDTVMDKIRQGGEMLADLQNLQPAARSY